MSSRANSCFLDSFLAYMEASAPFTAVDYQAVALAEIARCLVPKVQSDTMFVRAAPMFIEDLAASGIGARENQLRSRHRDWLSVSQRRIADLRHRKAQHQRLLGS
jgi:hypothetical protein